MGRVRRCWPLRVVAELASRRGVRAAGDELGMVASVGLSSDGSVIWLCSGPSSGKSSIARAIQRLGAIDDAWLHAGDEHLLRQVPSGLVVTAEPTGDPGGDQRGWFVPVRDGVIVGRPRVGPLALRVLDGMYRAVAGLAAAGNNVVLDDVVWDRDVAALALNALRDTAVLMVHIECALATSLARERARPDRLDGAVTAYAGGPRVLENFDLAVDTTSQVASECAAAVVERWRQSRHGTAMQRLAD